MRFAGLLCSMVTSLVVGGVACSSDDASNSPSGLKGSGGSNNAAGTGGQHDTGQGTGGTQNTAGSADQPGGASGSGGATNGSSGGAGAGGTADGGSMADAGGSRADTDGGGAFTYAPGNPPVLSAGCGKATTVTNGKKTIMSGGVARTYIIDIPTNYDMNKPYRFFYTSHWIGARAEDVVGQDYYFLKPLANAANEPAIFLAPQALPGNPGGTWDTQKDTDQVLFDNILAYVKENLCIDVSRVFATGFSFGGMMTYSLSVNHQKDIRAAVGIAPANYNIYVPKDKPHQPIAWMQTTGVNDGTCPWVNGNSTTQGSKFIAIEHATDNGCMIPGDIPKWSQGPHLCYDFTGCSAGHPTKACTFDGPHTNIANDPGSNTNWIPQVSWDFFKQF